jgi:hypothetical protein
MKADGYNWNELSCCFKDVQRIEQTLEEYDLEAENIIK